MKVVEVTNLESRRIVSALNLLKKSLIEKGEMTETKERSIQTLIEKFREEN